MTACGRPVRIWRLVSRSIQIYFGHGRQTEAVQADFVGLFELNREQSPVYLLQHRYNRETHATQVDLYKQLLERYRSCDITLKQGEGAVSHDQLSVQLEFIAYLCGYLAHASAGDDLAMRRAMLEDTVRMLHWIEGPIERLVQADVQHPVYFHCCASCAAHSICVPPLRAMFIEVNVIDAYVIQSDQRPKCESPGYPKRKIGVVLTT